MRRLHRFALVLLLIYAGMLVGLNYHTHPNGKDPLTADCKSCQVSQLAFEQVSSVDPSPQQQSVCGYFLQSPETVVSELSVVHDGRAPPSC